MRHWSLSSQSSTLDLNLAGDLSVKSQLVYAQLKTTCIYEYFRRFSERMYLYRQSNNFDMSDSNINTS